MAPICSELIWVDPVLFKVADSPTQLTLAVSVYTNGLFQRIAFHESRCRVTRHLTPHSDRSLYAFKLDAYKSKKAKRENKGPIQRRNNKWTWSLRFQKATLQKVHSLSLSFYFVHSFVTTTNSSLITYKWLATNRKSNSRLLVPLSLQGLSLSSLSPPFKDNLNSHYFHVTGPDISNPTLSEFNEKHS